MTVTGLCGETALSFDWLGQREARTSWNAAWYRAQVAKEDTTRLGADPTGARVPEKEAIEDDGLRLDSSG